MTALLWQRPLAAAPVPVRFVEGSLHGFLVLSTPKQVLLASGDLLQVVRDGEVKTRLVFHFKDGSVLDETVVFTQRHVFTMQSYHLVQRGPVFPEDTEISLERASGKYHVKTRAHKDGREKVQDGTLDLPPDVSNGMVLTIVKNLSAGAGETVHMVAFTPAPKLIKLQMTPADTQKILVGGSGKNRNPLRPQADPRNLVEALRLAAWARAPGQSRLDRYRRCAGIREVRRSALHERTGLADRIDEPPLVIGIRRHKWVAAVRFLPGLILLVLGTLRSLRFR